jgi:hypothetical protein
MRQHTHRLSVYAFVGLVICWGVLSPGPSFGLEKTNADLRLVLHESNGRFSLYAKDRQTARFVPLFVANDPRTSFLSVLIGNRVYRMGESSGVSQETESTDSGGRFVWTSSRFRVVEEFAFTQGAEGVTITIEVENTSEQALGIGVRLLLDTYLGEDRNTHFQIPGDTVVQQERAFAFDAMPAWWESDNNEEDDGILFRALLLGEGVTRPDRIVFANWKRLNDTTWSYDVNSARDFNLLPYSINDSAVCHYYDPLQIQPGEARSVVLALGTFEEAAPQLSAADPAPTAETTVQPSSAAAGEEPESELLTEINELIDEINRRLESDEPVTDEEVEELRQRLEALRSRAQD